MLLIRPYAAHAAVRITEVAWMGVAGTNGQYGEWVELFNDGTEAVDLAGWTLTKDGGNKLIFTLTKTISPNGYLLIERTTASMQDPVPGVDDESGTFANNGLANTGEDLVLKDASGVAVHTLSFASGWPAGDAATKETMQWYQDAWVTAPATPKAISSAPAQAEETEEDENSEESEEETDEEPAVKKIATSAPKRVVPKFTLAVPAETYQYVEGRFAATLTLEDGQPHTEGTFVWNMGDGTVIEQNELVPLMHRYSYPGTYTVWVGYFATVFDAEPTLEAVKTVKVTIPALTVTALGTEAVQIENTSSAAVDLSKWRIISNHQYAILPDRTMIAPKSSITLSGATLGFIEITPDVAIARPGGEVIQAPVAAAQQSTTVQTPTPKKVSVKQKVVRRTSPLQAYAQGSPAAVEGAFADASAVEENPVGAPTQNRTKRILFGAVALTVLALFVLLERFMAKRE